MPLPIPTTTSPGFLELQYVTGAVNHKIRQRYIAGVDPTDVTVVTGEATAWAAALGPCMANTCVINGFRSLDPSGVEYFSGVLASPVTGSNTHTSVLASESATFDLIGRGNPGGGLAQGNTRHMWFPGVIFTDWPGAQAPLPLPADFIALLAFLNADAVIGADFYGSKAVFVNKLDQQINAHYQKRYGF